MGRRRRLSGATRRGRDERPWCRSRNARGSGQDVTNRCIDVIEDRNDAARLLCFEVRQGRNFFDVADVIPLGRKRFAHDVLQMQFRQPREVNPSPAIRSDSPSSAGKLTVIKMRSSNCSIV